MQKSFKHVLVDDSNYETLSNLKGGASFNDVISQLLKNQPQESTKNRIDNLGIKDQKSFEEIIQKLLKSWNEEK